jgi:hypothetical protein
MAKDDGLGLDFLTQIVNVQWAEGGGAIFIFGEWLGNKLHYVKVKDKKTEPATEEISLPESDIRDLDAENVTRFATVGGSYGKKKKKDKDGNFTIDDKDAKPVFTVCGGRGVSHTILDENENPIPVNDSHAVIYTSNDGLEWSKSHEESAVISAFATQPHVAPTALVWEETPDKQSFYYAQHRDEVRFDPGGDTVEAFDVLFSSPDGASWAEEGSQDTVGADPSYKSPFLEHTKHNDCIDAFDQHVPDGFSTTDKKKKITAKPDKPPTVFYYEGGSPGYGDGTSQVVIETEDAEGEKQTKTVSVPIANITCVAACNGIFLAGGFVVADDVTSAGAAAISTDKGDTWKHLVDTQNGVVFMIVAPTTDLSPEEPTA